jgi:hypothetical protein
MDIVHAYRCSTGQYLLTPVWAPPAVPPWSGGSVMYMGTLHRQSLGLDVGGEVDRQIDERTYAVITPGQLFSVT